jgi:hypothetical protein
MDTINYTSYGEFLSRWNLLDLLYSQRGEVGENIYTDNNEKSK